MAVTVNHSSRLFHVRDLTTGTLFLVDTDAEVGVIPPYYPGDQPRYQGSFHFALPTKPTYRRMANSQ